MSKKPDWVVWKVNRYGDRMTKAHAVLSWASNKVACGLSTVKRHPSLAEATVARCELCLRRVQGGETCGGERG